MFSIASKPINHYLSDYALPIRRLAAIMPALRNFITDIVRYTAMMGKDSNRELVRQSKHIQKPLVEKHNGLWLKEMGDGAMAQFGSVLDTVNCSLEIEIAARLIWLKK